MKYEPPARNGSDVRRMYQGIENSTRIRPLLLVITPCTALSCRSALGTRRSRKQAVVGIAALQVRDNLDLRGKFPESGPDSARKTLTYAGLWLGCRPTAGRLAGARFSQF